MNVITNPYTGDSVESVPFLSQDEAVGALTSLAEEQKAWAALHNTGQSCCATKRAVVRGRSLTPILDLWKLLWHVVDPRSTARRNTKAERAHVGGF